MEAFVMTNTMTEIKWHLLTHTKDNVNRLVMEVNEGRIQKNYYLRILSDDCMNSTDNRTALTAGDHMKIGYKLKKTYSKMPNKDIILSDFPELFL